jgi:hypothetical protein
VVRHPADGGEHVVELARRQRAAAERVDDDVERRVCVVGAAHARQFERQGPVGALRHDRLHAHAQRRRMAALGKKDDPLDLRLGLLAEQLLRGDRLLVAGAGRPAGGIAAVSRLEFHG